MRIVIEITDGEEDIVSNALEPFLSLLERDGYITFYNCD